MKKKLLTVEIIDIEKSSWLSTAEFDCIDCETGNLVIKTNMGQEYHHMSLPISIWEDFKNAPSKGTFYNKNIKNNYPSIRPIDIKVSIMEFVHCKEDSDEIYIYEVEYSYDPPVQETRSLPRSPGEILISSITENGIEIMDLLSLEVLSEIEKSCLVDYCEGFD